MKPILLTLISPIENAIRPVASHEAAQRSAILYSPTSKLLMLFYFYNLHVSGPLIVNYSTTSHL